MRWFNAAFSLKSVYWFTLLLWTGCPWIVGYAIGHALPDSLTVPSNFGVSMNRNAGSTQDKADHLDDLGVGWTRMTLHWWEVEHTAQKNYDWSYYDPIVDALGSRGINVVFTLGYGNQLYGLDDSHGGPTTPEQRNAFAEYAASAAAHYRQRNPNVKIVWEVWNEPNEDGFWQNSDAVAYTQLVEETRRIMDQKAPGSVILGPATSNANSSAGDVFTLACINQGILNHIDGLSSHFYTRNPIRRPEDSGADYAQIRQWMADAGKTVPIVASEWGYASRPKSGSFSNSIHLTQTQQAQYLTRMFLYNTYQQIPLTIWYNLINDAPDPNTGWIENMGLLWSDHTEKTAFTACEVLIESLEGGEYVDRVPTSSGNDYALRFFDPATGTDTLAVWTTGLSHSISITDYVDPENAFRVYLTTSMTGANGTLTASATGALSVPISQSPMYIFGLPSVVPEPGACAGIGAVASVVLLRRDT